MNPLWVLIGREFKARIGKKGYWFFTVFGVVVMVALTFMPAIMHWIQNKSETSVVIVDPQNVLARQLKHEVEANQNVYSFNLTATTDNAVRTYNADQMKQFMKQHHTHLVALLTNSNALNPSFTFEEDGTVDPSTIASLKSLIQNEVYSLRVAVLPKATQLQLMAPVQFATHQWQTGAKSGSSYSEAKILVYYMLTMLFMTLMIYGVWVSQGIIEEKSNRIIEMMLITVKPWQILFGKVLGIGLVGCLQYLIWIAAVSASLIFQRNTSLIPLEGISPGVIVAFPVFFILGYLMYATLFGIAGSLVNRPEEQQMAVAPVSFMLAILFYASIFALFNPTSTFAEIVSFIPLLTPLTMFSRVALTIVPVWHIVLSISLTILLIVLLVWSGARIYRRFALNTTGKSGWKLLFGRQLSDHTEAK